ncbi:MAG TPA: ABC transporter substrate-binding protein [Chloroflexota bacterium]|nr:ABC transporter substrate-binding protein [Chloroflexota bacterium]
MDCWRTLLLLSLLLTACRAAPVASERGGAASAPAVEAPSAPAPSAPPAPLEAVRVGTVGSATDAIFYWAQERGYLREQGLELDVTVFNGAQQMIAPLGTDQLDVGAGGPGPGLFNAILRGVNVRIVADRSRAAPPARNQCLVVRKSLLDSGAVRSFADLRGRVFAENVPAVLTTAIVERELQRAGLSLEDVTRTTLSFPDMLVGFANDAVDFAVLVEPFITLGEQRELLRCWKYTSELQPHFQIAVVLYGPAFAEQRTELARRFMVAYLRAVRDHHRAFFGDGAHRAELIRLMGRVGGISDLELLERLGPSWMDPNGEVNVESLRDTQRWYVGRGEQIGEVDFDRVVDSRFVEYALAQLGRYPTP